MRVTVTGMLVKRCPHVDELDVGTVEASWDYDGVELHIFRKYLDSWRTEKLTHERITHDIAGHLRQHAENVKVVTHWTTAGLDVTVTA